MALAILAVLAGCQTPQAPFDPFLQGRTTIPPPATATPATVPGTAAPAIAPPGAAAPAIVPANPAPITPIPSTAPAPGTSNPAYLPGSGFSYPQSQNTAPAANPNQLASATTQPAVQFGARVAPEPNRPNPSAIQPPPSAATNGAAVMRASFNEPATSTTPKPSPLAKPENAIRIVEPTGPAQPSAGSSFLPTNKGAGAPLSPSSTSTGGASGTRAAALGAASGTRGTALQEITELPASGNSASVAASRTVETRSSTATSHTAASADYSHDPQYRWLRGKLEYSASQRQWKLRYIPIDGATDDYGGSVVLDDSPELEKARPGQVVTVYGQVSGENATTGGFSPAYRIERIVP